MTDHDREAAMHPRDIRIDNPDWVPDVIDLDRRYTDRGSRVRVAITLASESVRRGTGGPFGAAIFEVESGVLAGVGTNAVLRLGNSSAHAEIVAIMMAQARVGSYTLRESRSSGGLPVAAHELVSSCEPCAMCLGATLWSGVSRLVFSATRDDVSRLGFDEGPVFPESYAYLRERGVEIVGGVLRDEGAAVFALYRERGGVIYNR